MSHIDKPWEELILKKHTEVRKKWKLGTIPYAVAILKGVGVTLCLTILLIFVEMVIKKAVDKEALSWSYFGTLWRDVESVSYLSKNALLTMFVWYVIELFVSKQVEPLRTTRIIVLIFSMVWFLGEEAFVKGYISVGGDVFFLLVLILLSGYCLVKAKGTGECDDKVRTGPDDGKISASKHL